MERPIGLLERYSAVRRRNNLNSVVLMTAVYDKPLTKPALYAALAHVVENEPMLCLNLFGAKPKEVLRIVPVDLDQVVLWRPEVVDQQALADELLTPDFEIPQAVAVPNWRIAVIGEAQTTAVFFFDHVCLDGMSGVFVLQRLTKALNEAVPFNGQFNKILPLSQVIPPPMEKVLDLRPSFRFVVTAFYELIKEKLLGHKALPPNAVDLNIVATMPLRAKSRLLEISAADTAALLSICRKQGLTFTSLVTVAFLKTLVDSTISPDHPDKFVPMGTMTAVSPRRKAKSKVEVGDFNYSARWDCDLKRDDVSSVPKLVELARRYGEILAQEKTETVTSGLHMVGMIGYIDLDNHMLGLVGKRTEATLNVSNVGAVAMAPGEFTVQKLYFSQVPTVSHPPYMISMITLKNGPASVCIASAEGGWAECERLVSGMGEVIKEVIQAGDF